MAALNLITNLLPTAVGWLSLVIGLFSIWEIIGFRASGDRHPMAITVILASAFLISACRFWTGSLFYRLGAQWHNPLVRLAIRPVVEI